jgi:hypothetical protein
MAPAIRGIVNVDGDPMRYFDNGRTLLISMRLMSAMRRAGWAMVSSEAGYKRVNGIRRRLDMEDLLNGIFIAIGAKTIRQMPHNDQARDEAARQIWETFHHNRVVLRRVAR